MTPGQTFDTVLDRCLALSGEPPVPPGLARRIVVRAAQMPQGREWEFERNVIPFARPVRSRWLGRSPRYAVGGAIAAALAMVMFAGGVVGSELGTRGAAPGQASAVEIAANEPVPAILQGDAALGHGPRAASKPAQSRDVALASRAAAARPDTGGDDATAAAVGGSSAKPVEMAENGPAADPLRARAGPADEAFALASGRRAPEGAFGPVLEPEWDLHSSAVPGTGGRVTGMGIGASAVPPPK